MLSTQTHIALQIVATLSPAEIAAFEKEFSKRFASQKANSMPTKIKKQYRFDPKVMAANYLANWRKKHNIRCK